MPLMAGEPEGEAREFLHRRLELGLAPLLDAAMDDDGDGVGLQRLGGFGHGSAS